MPSSMNASVKDGINETRNLRSFCEEIIMGSVDGSPQKDHFY